MKIRVSQLEKLIRESVRAILDEETYVDSEGWAYDDEGGTYFVGKQNAGTAAPQAQSAPHQMMGTVKQKTSDPVFAQKLSKAISLDPNNMFLQTTFGELTQKGDVTPKQRIAASRIFRSLRLEGSLKEGYYSDAEKQFMQSIRDAGGNVAYELAADPWKPEVQAIFDAMDPRDQRSMNVRELRRNSQHFVAKQQRRRRR